MTTDSSDSSSSCSTAQSMGAVAGWCHSAWRYSYSHYWELPANVLEGITLVLVVFVQDVAFKESIVTCAGLLTASFVLHGLAYRAGQCQVCGRVQLGVDRRMELLLCACCTMSICWLFCCIWSCTVCIMKLSFRL